MFLNRVPLLMSDIRDCLILKEYFSFSYMFFEKKIKAVFMKIRRKYFFYFKCSEKYQYIYTILHYFKYFTTVCVFIINIYIFFCFEQLSYQKTSSRVVSNRKCCLFGT